MPEITTKATIRDAEVRDHQRIADIYGYHVLNGLASFEESPPDVAEISRRFDVVRALDMPYIVAELDGDIVGYAYCSSYRPRPAYRFTVENTVYVDHRFPRRRLGYLLLESLIERIECTPVRQMIAVIGDSDHVASIKLHESLGFRMVGTLKGTGFKFGRWVDTVIMQKPINGGDENPPRI
jgi:L-amino acid N-acyltransferase YncA